MQLELVFHNGNLATNAGTSAPVIRLTVCLTQPKKTFSECESRSSIHKTYKVLGTQFGTASYLALAQTISTICSAARELGTIQGSTFCHALPILRGLRDDANVRWRSAGASGTIVVDDGRGCVRYGEVSIWLGTFEQRILTIEETTGSAG